MLVVNHNLWSPIVGVCSQGSSIRRIQAEKNLECLTRVQSCYLTWIRSDNQMFHEFCYQYRQELVPLVLHFSWRKRVENPTKFPNVNFWEIQNICLVFSVVILVISMMIANFHFLIELRALRLIIWICLLSIFFNDLKCPLKGILVYQCMATAIYLR